MSKIDENSVQVTANETHMIIHRNVKKKVTRRPTRRIMQIISETNHQVTSNFVVHKYSPIFFKKITYFKFLLFSCQTPSLPVQKYL